MTTLPNIKIRLKAAEANWHAGAGQTIAGHLGRDAHGHFIRIGGNDQGDPSVTPQMAAARVAAQIAGEGGGGKKKGGGKKGGGGKGKAPKKTPEEKKAELAQQRKDNISKGAGQVLSGDAKDAFISATTEFNSPNDLDDKAKAALQKAGLAAPDANGKWQFTKEGLALQKALGAGDMQAAQIAADKGASNVTEAENKVTPDQKKMENLGKVSDKLLGDDSEAFTAVLTGQADSLDEVKPEYQKSLESKGLIAKDANGKYAYTNEGKAFQNAAQRGDEKGAKSALQRASATVTVNNQKTQARLAKASNKKKEVQLVHIRFKDKDHPTPAQRKKMPAGDFVFSDERAFPVSSPDRVEAAVRAWGEYRGKHSHADFVRNLKALVARHGWPASVLPANWNVEKKDKSSSKIRLTMGEFKRGSLHSGSAKGPLVTNRKQAIAIALNQANKEGQSGVMIAFYLPPDAAYQVMQANTLSGATPPQGLHLTLCYLGDMSEIACDRDQLLVAVSKFAAFQKPIDGVISGTGRFSNVDEGAGLSAFYASFDSPALPAFRQALVDSLLAAGIDYYSNHGYTPHITLSYLPAEAPTPTLNMPPVRMCFDRISLCFGPERIDIMLGATKEVAAAPAGYAHGPGGLASIPALGGKKPKIDYKAGDFVGYPKPGGSVGYGRIVSVHKASTVPQTSVRTVGTTKEPTARVLVHYKDEKGTFQPSGEYVAVKLSSLMRPKRYKETEVERGSFTVVKQADGQYRWVTMSSSGFMDHDKEIVPTEELIQDILRADKEQSYGPLRWWHLPSMRLGECDWNDMCGRVLVESGTFDDPEVAEALIPHLEDLGVSIGFKYIAKENGVYRGIQRFERSLLPAAVASNPLTRVFIPNGEEDMPFSEQKKRGFLAGLIGEKNVVKVEHAAEQAEKEALEAGMAYKAKSPLDDTEKDPNAAPPPGVPADTKAAGAVDPTQAADSPAAATDQMDAMNGDGGTEDAGEGGDFEDSPADNAIDMTIQEIYDLIGNKITEAITAALEPIKASLGSATEAKEAKDDLGALASAFKEVAVAQNTAIKQIAGEITALKSTLTETLKETKNLKEQIAKLVGEMPPAAQRASQSQYNVVNQQQAAQKQAGADGDAAAINQLSQWLANNGLSLGS